MMRRYRVKYYDSIDPACPDFSCIIWAAHPGEAEDIFYESEPDETWVIRSIREVS